LKTVSSAKEGAMSLFRPGALLGLLIFGILVGCATPSTRPAAAPQSRFALGQNGVRLHYLDFGGGGDPVLLLAGVGNTAWIYSEFGRELARDHRVFALTRRGHGESDMPEHGYDQATLAEDIRLFLDQQGIRRVHLIGHAVAGGELTRFAGEHPDRVASLIYLDAAYDRATQGPVERGNPERPAPPSPADRTSIDAYVAYLFRTRPIYALYQRAVVERDTRAALALQPDGTAGFRMGQSQFGELMSGLSSSPPDYRRVQAPALAIYAAGQSAFRLSSAAPEQREALGRFLTETVEPWRRASIEQFRRGVVGGEIVEMDAVHHLFLHKPAEAAALARLFLRRHPAAPVAGRGGAPARQP
jgi:pimeloyl-ACP methyl ester carboxylesterase